MSTFQKARAQCLKALDIVDTTQLTLFLQREPESREKLVEQIDSFAQLPEEKALAAMQTLLSDVMAVYNDPFANYINPKQHKAYTERRTGGFVGLGLKFRTQTEDYPVVIGALLGGPLEERDMEPGDKIISVNDEDLHALSSRQVSTILKGPPDSTARLKLQRNGETFDLETRRQSVQLQYARTEMHENNVGYIKVSRFGGKTHVLVRQLLKELISDGAKSLVLDLRDNPGGSTRAARNMLSIFHKAPWVYCEQYKTGKINRLPRDGDWLTDMPLSVLVNEYSMSSSEILAGALQDYKRAKLIGAPTYGKGLIQRVFPLAEPLGGAVRTTIAMYGTPSHTLLHGRGLLPDVYVPTAPERLFKETGSVNISDKARAFRRSLFMKSLKEKLSAEVVSGYEILPDTQLEVAKTYLH